VLLLIAAVMLGGCVSDQWPADRDDGRVRAASLRDAVASAQPEPITDVPVQQRPWNFGGHTGQLITTPHYRIYTTMTRQSVIDRLPLFLERAMANYTTALAPLPEPGRHLDTYLFESRGQWEAKTRQLLPKQASIFLALGRGGFTTRGISVLYYIGRNDTLHIAAHEGWHQFSQETFRSQLPLWLEEGIATYMEGYLSHPDGLPKFRPWANRERYHALREAVQANGLLSLDAVLRRTPQSFLHESKSRLLVYYAQVWALTLFLTEGENGRYRLALQEVLLDAERGRLAVEALGTRGGPGGVRLGPAVLKAYFDTDVDAFERAYLQFVNKAIRTGGRDRIDQGRSPVD
jgi:hypothetical protein